MAEIKSSLKQHGVVCIKSVGRDNFGAEELIAFGSAFKEKGDELICLPKELSFNNKDPNYPEIARVGNILIDGSMKDSSKEAIVWH